MAKPWEERVRERAYAIWEREGCPEGQESDHWRRAETELEVEEPRVAPTAPASAEIARKAGATSSAKPAKKPRTPRRKQPS